VVGGTILTPVNGKTYKCKIAVEDGGKKLKVRGYIGMSLQGRTQRWGRAESHLEGSKQSSELSGWPLDQASPHVQNGAHCLRQRRDGRGRTGDHLSQLPRLQLTRKAEPFQVEALPGSRNLRADDNDLMGELLYAAYHGSIDDEGESPEAARQEVARTFGGAYGPVLWDCSFIVIQEGQAVGATIVTDYASGPPLLAYVIVKPSRQRSGLAQHLLKRTLDALHRTGRGQMRLFVTAGNTPAVNLYRKLEFSFSEEAVRHE